jgi:phosphatidyl-myo-inositol dimannoside synthase
MKIALLAVSGAYQIDGGIAAVNRLVIKALNEMGFSIHLFVLCESELDNFDSIPPFLRSNYLCFENNKVNFSFAIWKALLAQRYSLVMVDQINLASILAPLKLARNCDYLVWLHGIEVFPPRPNIEGWLGLHFARKCLANSNYTKYQVLKRYPTLTVQVCDLALEPDRHNLRTLSDIQISNEIKLMALDGDIRRLGNQVILNVGRMDSNSRYKGQDELLLGFPKINETFPESQLVLAGDGNDRQRIMDLGNSLPVEYHHRIFIPGFVSQELLDILYQSCYLFAMPSSGEGFGLVYLEAMARGKPCLGSKLDAARCIIQDGETGLLVDDPRSPEKIADLIIELLNDSSRAFRLGKAGYELLQLKYLYPHFYKRFQNAISLD